ncbi:MAG: DUF3465 domain-containing protein [Planctomycetota bacterium]|nr:DUF3465 domain-containing protein [Planctomycetota bacterium]
MALRKRTVTRLVILLILTGVWLWQRQQAKTDDGPPPDAGSRPANPDPGASAKAPPAEAPNDPGALARAVAQQRSGVWVESSGRIVHLLKDDREPPRHQRCLVDILDGHTIKISHNIDLAPRVPWRKGQKIGFRGRFEWNDKGGVVHWTHHDPQGRKQGGWLQVDGKRYR